MEGVDQLLALNLLRAGPNGYLLLTEDGYALVRKLAST